MKILAPRWRKVIRDMWRNKSRTALVVMSIAVGVFAIGVVSGAQRVFLAALNTSYSATNPASGTVFLNDAFDENLVETIDNMRGVAIAEGQRNLTLRYKMAEGDDWQTIQLTTVADFEEMVISKVIPKGGAWPPPDKQMLMELTSLEWLGAEIGDVIQVETAEGKIRTMDIAGVVRSQNGPPASVSGQPTAFINQETLEWLGEARNLNRLNFIVAENDLDRDHIREVGDLIRNKIENSGLEVTFVRVPPPW